MAVITGKCLFLGQIISVDQDKHTDGQVHVHCITAAQSLGYGEYEWDWAFPPFAESVQEGDIVCHLQGAAKPSIVRLCQDHFRTIKTTAQSVPSGATRKRDRESDRQSDSLEDHFCNIALTFTIPLESSNDWDGVEESAELLDVAPEYHEEPVEERKRLDDTTALLEDCFACASGYRGNIPVPVSPAWKRLIEQCGPKILISERVVQAIVGCPTGKPDEVLQVLFEKRGDKLPITEKIVGAAAANQRMGHVILQQLFEKRGKRLPVSEHVIVTAAENKGRGFEIMDLLFRERGRDIVISEEVVVATARNYGSGPQVIRLLFEQRGEDLPISERVVKTAAANTASGYKIMQVLFQQRGSLRPSEEVVAAAAGNPGDGLHIMQLLFDRDEDLVVSENTVKAAAENEKEGYGIMLLLLEKRGREGLTISEAIVEAAQDNLSYGRDIMQLLEQQKLL
jgi:hypothetical protein